jgi:hypothetical protein
MVQKLAQTPDCSQPRVVFATENEMQHKLHLNQKSPSPSTFPPLAKALEKLFSMGGNAPCRSPGILRGPDPEEGGNRGLFHDHARDSGESGNKKMRSALWQQFYNRWQAGIVSRRHMYLPIIQILWK